MKVVINKCYGGFSLSDEAIRILYRKGSKIIEIHKPDEYYYGKKERWEEMFEEDKKNNRLPIVGNKILTVDTYDYSSRSDPILVETIERLGERANGDYSDLKIVEIPDDVDYTIGEYDGMEWVAEKHRTWS